MPDQPPIAPYPISDFLQWQGAEQLVLQPRFQRGKVWSEKAQSYLIDTIVRQLPIPPIVVRLKTDLKIKRTIREVVDGQQRLSAIFRFVNGEIRILATHNSQFPDKTFSELPLDFQELLLSYKLPVWTIENVDDAHVLDIFARLNTFVVPLNAQEKRNARFFGEYKQSSYSLGSKHLPFWQLSKTFTDMRIARMADVQLTSVLLMTMLKGITATKPGDIDKIYEEYDAKYSQRVQNEKRFSAIFDHIANSISDVSKSSFRREIHFYSLFNLFYDAEYGLPGGRGPQKLPKDLTVKLADLSSTIARLAKPGATPAKGEAEFQRASSRATADVGARRLRHAFYWDAVFGA